MGSKNLHGKPFDETTIAKLEIFEEYVEAWLPTFVMLNEPTVCVFDFFAGTGYDKAGIPGSPIRILMIVKKFVTIISQRGTKVKIYLNEYKAVKFDALKSACEKYLDENPDVKAIIELEYNNKDFDICFTEWIPLIERFPSLVFLDQNGIKYLSNKYFHALEKTTKTDFLYFVSSSYFLRFGDREEFKKHFSFDIEKAREDPYALIHRNLIKQLKDNLPSGTTLKLYPFTLKKGSNIHGIIFGAKSPRAVEKFLGVAWARNGVNGDANFDIDDDLSQSKTQYGLFEPKKPTKIEAFKDQLEQKIKSKSKVTNIEIFLFTLDLGHPPKHAADHLRELKRDKKIHYEGQSPRITFEALMDKKNLTVNIDWIAK
jgi:three-Cys-motif partner protein